MTIWHTVNFAVNLLGVSKLKIMISTVLMYCADVKTKLLGGVNTKLKNNVIFVLTPINAANM